MNQPCFISISLNRNFYKKYVFCSTVSLKNTTVSLSQNNFFLLASSLQKEREQKVLADIFLTKARFVVILFIILVDGTTNALMTRLPFVLQQIKMDPTSHRRCYLCPKSSWDVTSHKSTFDVSTIVNDLGFLTRLYCRRKIVKLKLDVGLR